MDFMLVRESQGFDGTDSATVRCHSTSHSGLWSLGGLGEAGVSRRLLNLCHIHKGQKYNIL